MIICLQLWHEECSKWCYKIFTIYKSYLAIVFNSNAYLMHWQCFKATTLPLWIWNFDKMMVSEWINCYSKSFQVNESLQHSLRLYNAVRQQSPRTQLLTSEIIGCLPAYLSCDVLVPSRTTWFTLLINQESSKTFFNLQEQNSAWLECRCTVVAWLDWITVISSSSKNSYLISGTIQ